MESHIEEKVERFFIIIILFWGNFNYIDIQW